MKNIFIERVRGIQMSRQKFKAPLTIFFIMIYVLTTLVQGQPIAKVYAAQDIEIEWLNDQTMNEKLELSDTYDTDEVMLRWNLSQNGTYTLTYYLEDGERTEITLSRIGDLLDIGYDERVYDISYSDPDPINNNWRPVTEDEYNLSYSQMDFTQLVPDWTTPSWSEIENTSGSGIRFEVEKTSVNQYPGVVFNINNTNVRMKWDLGNNDFYFITNGVQEGNIMPFVLDTPEGQGSIDILRSLEDLTVTPTHWIKNSAGDYENLDTIQLPGDSEPEETPGKNPGIEVSFKQPKIFHPDVANNFSYQYATGDELENVNAIIGLKEVSEADGSYKDFIFQMDSTSSTTEIQDSDGAQYTYDSGNSQYTIEIVKDRSKLDDSNQFLEWNELEPSCIYDMNFTFDTGGTYGQTFKSGYKPESNYAYTYIKYDIHRTSMQDAYLEVIPYGGSENQDLEYTVLYGKSKDELAVWSKHYHNAQDTDTALHIPIPFDETSSQDFYQISVSFAGEELFSQILRYIAKNDDNVPPPAPEIISINNLRVVPPLLDDGLDEPEKIQFDLYWRAPENDGGHSVLDDIFNGGDDDHLYYELYMSDLPDETEADPYTPIKVFEVLKDSGTGEYSLVEVDQSQVDFQFPGEGTAQPVDGGLYEEGYNETDERFAMQGVELKTASGWIQELQIDTTGSYDVAATGTSIDAIDLPSVHFLRMRAVSEVDGEVRINEEKSLPISLSLSMLTQEVPIPEELEYENILPSDDTAPIKVNLTWNVVNTTGYDNSMLSPVGKGINELNYRIYLSKSRNEILNLKEDESEYYSVSSSAVQVVDGVTILEGEGAVDDDANSIIDHLRQDDIIYYDVAGDPSRTQGTVQSQIQNLDNNEVYYARIVTRLQVEDSDGDVEDELRISDPSEVLSITTNNKPQDPLENEKAPTAPENFRIKDVLSNSAVALEWEFTSEPVEEEETIGFELIRVKGKSLPSEYKSGTKAIEDIVEEDEDIEGWRLMINPGEESYSLSRYKEEGTEWNWNEEIGKHTVADHIVTLTDDTLSPNVVYYYYVRAIRVPILSNIPASAWVGTSTTTEPVGNPRNLVQIIDDSYSYDPKHEAVIRFDVPVPETEEDSFVPQIFVKGDYETEYTYTEYDYTQLTLEEETGEAAEGYKRYVYRISDFKSGSSYSVKVRVEDQSQTLDDGSHPVSSFSERIVIRTDFDQGDYDKENKYIEYLELYEEKAQELFNTQYWISRNSSSRFEAKLRGDIVVSELDSSNVTYYDLPTDDQEENTYYIPMTVFESANRNKVHLRIQYGDTEIIIRPDSIEKEEIEAIQDTIDDVQDDSSLKDYYIRLHIEFSEYDDDIQGADPVGEYVQIEMEGVPSEETESRMEYDIEDALQEQIDDHKVTFINKLEDALDEEVITDEDLTEILLDMLEIIQDDFEDDVEDILDDSMDSHTNKIHEVSNPMLMNTLGTDLVDIKGYQKVGGNWVERRTMLYNNKTSMEIQNLGNYIFASNQLVNTYVEDLPQGGDIKDIINRYGLMDYLTEDDLLYPTTSITKNKLYKVAAAMVGAPYGTDPVSWLQDKGISRLSKSNPYQPLKREDGIYLMMELYAIKNNTPVASIVVRNYNAVKDLQSAQAKNRDHILRAASLALIDLQEGYFNPIQPLTTGDALRILADIEKHIW